MPDALISVPEAAAILGVSRSSGFRMAKDGSLPMYPGSARQRVVTARLSELIGREISEVDIASARETVKSKKAVF